MSRIFQSILFLAILGSTISGNATIINVPIDQPTIQSAIDAAMTDDTVLVASGTYIENLRIVGKGIVLSSHFLLDQDPAYIFNTIIDGSQPDHPDTASVILIYGTGSLPVTVQGFTITKGTGTLWQDPHNHRYYREGGGILCQSAYPNIKYNLIIDNDAIDRTGASSAGGGGMRIDGGDPYILNNIIMYNSGLYGAGVVLNYTYGTLKNNVIVFNTGGGDYGGSGVWKNAGGSAMLENNTIFGNSSSLYGGGVVIFNANMTARNTIIYGNTAPASAQIYLTSGAAFTARYCDIQGGYTGDGNIDADPKVIGAFLYLDDISPCIDAGDTSVLINDFESPYNSGTALWPALGNLRGDMGAYGGPAGFPFELAAIIADTTFGWIPLPVNFKARSRLDVTDWKWRFGDGDSAVTEEASHTYQTQGLFDVNLEVTLSGDNYTAGRKDLIAILADSVIAGNAGGSSGSSIAIPIFARTTVPLKKLIIPIEYSGVLDLAFDSFSTAGCRTSAFANNEITYTEPGQMVIELQNSTTNYPPELEPGYGQVLNVYFTIQSGGSANQQNVIALGGFSGYLPVFSNRRYSYQPIAQNGSLTFTFIYGDANGDERIDLLDILYLISYKYKGGLPPDPLLSGDANCDSKVDLLDILFLISYKYKGGDEPHCP
jgi:PKD repeat protein